MLFTHVKKLSLSSKYALLTYQINLKTPFTHVKTDMINEQCHQSTQMHRLAIIALLMFGFSTWNLTVLWPAGGFLLNEGSQFALLKKYELRNSYLCGVKKLNCHCVINDWLLLDDMKNVIICYIPHQLVVCIVSPKETCHYCKTHSFFVTWFITPQKKN